MALGPGRRTLLSPISWPMIARRDLLRWVAAGVGTRLSPALAASPSATENEQPLRPFDFSTVVDLARELAKKPHQAPGPSLPGAFSNLSYDQYVAIRSKPGTAIWANEATGFVIEPLHRGFLFSAPVTINIVENGAVRRLSYNSGQFDFGKIPVPDNLPDIGFSGFRVLHTRSGKGLVEAAIFQGASFFRSLANGQNFGLTARALSIRTADPKGEEIPAFREVWIERPSPATEVLIVHGLVDSESMTGAYRFTLRPGDMTIVDTECTLFTRSPADFYGLGGMTAMFLFGPLNRHNIDDLRDGVYDVSGLQILNGNGEWLWRPVSNPQTLQISAFLDANPRGFGLLQRERNFAQLQDDDQHWEIRPSLWIEPINDWGEGSVALVEIPTDSENNDNVICFWRPKAILQPGAEAAFAYRQFWCWMPPDHPTLAVVTGTRAGRGSAAKRRRFLVEFSGELFADPQRSGEVQPALSVSVGNIVSVRPFLSRERKTCRVLFELEFGSEALAELRLVLQSNGKPVSETWLYRWTA